MTTRSAARKAKETKQGQRKKQLEKVDGINEVRTDLEAYKEATKKNDSAKCKQLLLKIKLAILEFDVTLPLQEDESVAAAQLSLGREALELATLHAVKEKDVKAFERNFVQVKTYYTDYGSLLEESERKWQLIALNLLCLLAHNRIAEFHTELELVSSKIRQENMYIKFPIALEQRLMEGNYNQVLRMRKVLPMPEYSFFTDMLAETVREKISDCAEHAYESIPLDDAQEMLLLDDKAALKKHISARGWSTEGGAIVFKTGSADERNVKDGAHRMMEQSLRYATELEKIV